MAKATPPKRLETKTLDANVLLSKAPSVQQGPDLYANQGRVSITQYEVYLDLYQVSPIQGTSQPKAVHIQRIIIPLNAAKGFVTAFSEVINQFEIDLQVQLPNYSNTPEDPQPNP